MWCKPKMANLTSLFSVPSLTPPLWIPCWPEGPSPKPGVTPAGTSEPLARKAGEGKRRRWLRVWGCYTDLENTSSPNLTHHPPPHPRLISSSCWPSPHTDKHSPCCLCVYMRLCTSILAKACVTKRLRPCVCVCVFTQMYLLGYVRILFSA